KHRYPVLIRVLSDRQNAATGSTSQTDSSAVPSFPNGIECEKRPDVQNAQLYDSAGGGFSNGPIRMLERHGTNAS
ncbi:hypothetical protein, partial [Corynebacterium sanguinis]|uniref:hypothetical protein n=1 Tax=Corynebacterium sanguinis TaxID=2594913 RepID=UPI001C940D24